MPRSVKRSKLATGGRASPKLPANTTAWTFSSCPILKLPDDLLQKILCSFRKNLQEWCDLALVCQQWKTTMQRLVPADFTIRKKSQLQHLESSSVKVGSITVPFSSGCRAPSVASSSLATEVQRMLVTKRVTSAYLQQLIVQPPLRLQSHSRSAWLLSLPALKKLELSIEMPALGDIVSSSPPNLEELALSIDCGYFAQIPVLTGLSNLKSLNSLKLVLMPEMHLDKQMHCEHKQKLAALLCASTALIGLPDIYRPTPVKHSAKCSANDKAVLSDVDGGSGDVEEPQAGELPPGCCTTPRVAKVAELAADACTAAEFSRKTSRWQGSPSSDCPHLLLQALQWLQALAMVLDADEPQDRGVSEQLQELWDSADIGRFWVDLRQLTQLRRCNFQGLPSVWLPSSLQQLEADTWGYTGPLPARLTRCSLKLRVASSMTHWELRPLGLLPLTELKVVINCSEERRSREFCFRILKGTHSLQLHSKLQRLCLMTDRGLHLDAEMSHHLLCLLAQKKQLRLVELGSESYRLRGDLAVGRGVAALNLLSDLKDHCGWRVNQGPKSTLVVKTTCHPPAREEWPFEVGDEQPDFISDFR